MTCRKSILSRENIEQIIEKMRQYADETVRLSDSWGVQVTRYGLDESMVRILYYDKMAEMRVVNVRQNKRELTRILKEMYRATRQDVESMEALGFKVDRLMRDMIMRRTLRGDDVLCCRTGVERGKTVRYMYVYTNGKIGNRGNTSYRTSQIDAVRQYIETAGFDLLESLPREMVDTIVREL